MRRHPERHDPDPLRQVQRDLNTTVILVTHDMEIAAQLDRLITLVDGRIEEADTHATAQHAAVQMFKEKRATGEYPVQQPNG